MTDPRCRQAVEASERFADGQLTERELDNLSAAAEEAYDEAIREPEGDHSTNAYAAHAASYSSSPSLALSVLLEAIDAAAAVSPNGPHVEWMRQADFLRDIFGNPFRPVSFSPEWRTSTALALASQMYESRDFSAMPILADALQDAVCDDEDILAHCRSEGAHVRGCWVVDLVLGME
jgi:hypothetical protein